MIAASVVDLAGARRPGDEDEPAGLLRELRQDRRQAELLEAQDLERDRAERAGDGAPLHVDVGAEAREALHAERQVELVVLLEVRALLLGEHREAELLGLDRPERRQAQGDDAAVDPQAAAASPS